MYQALYRKWRPHTFDDVVGQKHITETLKSQVKSGRLSHAYLFVGTRGTGKTTCAKILAKAINCEHPENGNPCNKCRSCTGIDSGTILDVEELDAASNNGVDNIRALREEAVFTPAAVRKRVYIVDEVHMLSMAAFNALLKILEEPPEHLTFILATTEIHKVPATIKSRCQRFSFKRISPPEIAERLKFVAEKEKMTLTEEAAELLSRLGDGSMRDALSLLDQCAWGHEIDVNRVENAVGLAGVQETCGLFDAAVSGETERALEIFGRLYCGGKEISSILEELMELHRDILIERIAPNGGEQLKSGTFSGKITEKYASSVSVGRLMLGGEVLQKALSDLDRSADRRFTAEMCLIKLCDPQLSGGIDALALRVEDIENKLDSGDIDTVKNTVKKPRADTEKDADNIEAQVDAVIKNAAQEATETNRAEIKTDIKSEPPVEASEKAWLQEDNTTAKADVGFDDDVWRNILGVVEGIVDFTTFMFLGDSHITPEYEGDVLTIRAKNAMAKNMLDTTDVKMALKAASEKVMGRPVTVKVTEFDISGGKKPGKLDSLKKFDNIKFE